MLLHVVGMIFMATYVFLFRKSAFDYVYLAIFYVILLHWTFLNGECSIAVLAKRVNNPDYVAGQDVHLDDVRTAYPGHETTILIINFIKNGLFLLNFYLVCVRNNIPAVFYSTFVFIYIFYLWLLSLYEYPYQNKSFLIVQEILKYTLIVGLLMYLMTWRKKRKNAKP